MILLPGSYHEVAKEVSTMNNWVTPLPFNLNSVRDFDEIVKLWQKHHGLFNCVQSKMIAVDDVDLTWSLDGEVW